MYIALICATICPTLPPPLLLYSPTGLCWFCPVRFCLVRFCAVRNRFGFECFFVCWSCSILFCSVLFVLITSSSSLFFPFSSLLILRLVGQPPALPWLCSRSWGLLGSKSVRECIVRSERVSVVLPPQKIRSPHPKHGRKSQIRECRPRGSKALPGAVRSATMVF